MNKSKNNWFDLILTTFYTYFYATWSLDLVKCNSSIRLVQKYIKVQFEIIKVTLLFEIIKLKKLKNFYFFEIKSKKVEVLLLFENQNWTMISFEYQSN